MNIIVKKPRVPLLIKLIIIAIPLFIFGYLITVNFIIDQEFNYFYDIGGEEDTAKPYLTPVERMSEIYNNSSENYRNVNYDLVYVNPPIQKGSEYADIQMRVIPPINLSFLLGARISQEWNYTWNELNLSHAPSGQWVVVGKKIQLYETYSINDKLSMAIHIPKFSSANGDKFSIDWINITVYKPGVFS
ncbi:hypothetical protein J4423_04665 [Candidatus Pacearchaeota archaeon]|nr:hypothetical protein [Candidatus Pacearchaeota archaeon]